MVSIPLSNLHTLPWIPSSFFMSLKDSIKKRGSGFHMQSIGDQRRASRVLETILLLVQFQFLFTLAITMLSSFLLGLLPNKTWRWFSFSKGKRKRHRRIVISKEEAGGRIRESRSGEAGEGEWYKLLYGSGLLRLRPLCFPLFNSHACHHQALAIILRLNVQALS